MACFLTVTDRLSNLVKLQSTHVQPTRRFQAVQVLNKFCVTAANVRHGNVLSHNGSLQDDRQHTLQEAVVLRFRSDLPDRLRLNATKQGNGKIFQQ